MTPTRRLLTIVGVLVGVHAVAAIGVLALDLLLPWD
jgi:hypothetical protein